MTHTCSDITAPNTSWNFCPNLGASIFFTLLFASAVIVHITQAIYYRKAYSWVLTMGATWQFLAYLLRDISIKEPSNVGAYATWFVLILVAPLWTNAYVYMVMGRMVWNFTSQAKVMGVTAWRFTLYFVILDITAFIIQVYGASSAAGNDLTVAQILKGLHIYMGGVGIQLFFNLGFVAFTIQFFRIVRQENRLGAAKTKEVFTLLFTLYAVLALIVIRTIFRLVEYSSGLDSTIPNHEAFQYCLDSFPMLVCFVLLAIVHPGRIMPGKEAEIPSRKARKAGAVARRSGIIMESNTNSVEVLDITPKIHEIPV